MPLLVLGLSHHSSPVTLRERFAFAESAIPQALQKLDPPALFGRRSSFQHAIGWKSMRPRSWRHTRLRWNCAAFCWTITGSRVRLGRRFTRSWKPNLDASLQSRFRLGFMVLGETEILGQLKKAYQTALEGQHTGAQLNKAFQKAFNVAKLIRSQTNIQRGSVSVGSVAVELAEKSFSALGDHPVMVVGAAKRAKKPLAPCSVGEPAPFSCPIVPLSGRRNWRGS